MQDAEPLQEIVIATEQPKPRRVRPPAHWKVRRTRISHLLQSKCLAPITVVEPQPTADLRSLASALAAKGFAQVGRPGGFLVWSLDVGRQLKPRHAEADLIRPFGEPERVEIARSSSDVDTLIRSLVAKVEVLAERAERGNRDSRQSGPRPSPLDRVRAVVDATKDLRVGGGNLSAEKTARLFGVSLSRLAKWLHRSRQALSKAPAADALQVDLGYFERIARLRAVFEEAEDLRKWLRMPNRQLEGKTPLAVLEQGRWQVLADLVDDMLTGSPS
jgi:hypothetical protein